MTLLAYAALLVLAVALHEAGHSAALTRAGRAPTAVHIGVGPVAYRRGRLHLHLLPVLGYVTSPPPAPTERVRVTTGTILAGCGANLAAGLLLLAAHAALTPAPRSVTLQDALGGVPAGSVVTVQGRDVPNTDAGQAQVLSQLTAGHLDVRTPDGRAARVPVTGEIVTLSAPPIPAVQDVTRRAERATRGTWQAAATTAQALPAGDLARIRERGLSSPVGAARALADLDLTLRSALLLAAVINLSMAAFNALPLPPLDGGQAALLLAERLRGRPLRPGVRAALTLAGAAVILSLITAAFIADLTG